MSTSVQNPDVIVVGAGVAGLSAAKALRDAGIETLVLEAAGHAGGRCVTDHTPFDVPFDRGGSWLHSAPINPLARIAERSDVPLFKTPWRWRRVQTAGYDLTPEEVATYQTYQEDMWAAIDARGAQQPDTSAADAMPPGPWAATAICSIPQMVGGDADATSAEDSSNYADAPGDWLVGGGLGAFIQSLHTDVPVVLNCPVHKIDYSGVGVSVSTRQGTLKAKHLILTVSTGVLAAGAIQFVPHLSIAKQEAVDLLPNGLLNKIGIEFDPAWQELKEGETADFHSGEEEFCSIQFGFFGSPLAVGFTAGRFAARLEAEGAGAATDYCIQALREIFGSDITKSIRRTDETAWLSNPLTYGAYSFARPGGAGARRILAQTIANRIFFAGEATMHDTFSTVHGAHLSGMDAAHRIKSTMGLSNASLAS